MICIDQIDDDARKRLLCAPLTYLQVSIAQWLGGELVDTTGAYNVFFYEFENSRVWGFVVGRVRLAIAARRRSNADRRFKLINR